MEVEAEACSDPLPSATLPALLFSLNLAAFGLQVPLSIYNFLFVYRTALLHPNLKHVLIAQCACFCCFAVAHSVQICIILSMFLHPDDAALITVLIGRKEHTHPIILFTVQLGNLIGHALIAERVLATVWARKYEQYNRPFFTLAWFLPMFIFAAYSSLQQILLHSDLENPISVFHLTAGNVISCYLSLALSAAEIIIFSIIGTKNLQRYNNWLRDHPGQHDLSERYQLAENIRTAQQLAPTFGLHFANITVFSVLPIMLYHNLIADEELMDVIMVSTLLILSVCNGLIEFTLISRHPILRRNAILHLQQLRVFLCSRRRVTVATTSTSMDSLKQRAKARVVMVATVTGGTRNLMANEGEADHHFLTLRQQWS